MNGRNLIIQDRCKKLGNATKWSSYEKTDEKNKI